MLFSTMVDCRNIRRTAMEMTAAGIEADTVKPTLSPRYAYAPARIAASTIHRMTALRVISRGRELAGMYGSCEVCCESFMYGVPCPRSRCPATWWPSHCIAEFTGSRLFAVGSMVHSALVVGT